MCEYLSHFSTDFIHKFDVATLAQANALGDIEFARPKETLPIVTVGKSAYLTLCASVGLPSQCRRYRCATASDVSLQAL